MKKILLATSALVALSTASIAADLPSSKGPPMAPVVYLPAFSWTGFYVGLQGGYTWGNSNWRTATSPGGAFIDSASFNPGGFMIGGHVGYNQQINQFVVGLEGDIEYSDLRGNSVGRLGAAFQSTRINWQGSIRARAGFAFDRTLIYATGGAAFADIKHNYGIIGGPTLGSYGDTRFGWTLGAGVEYAFTNNLTGRLEYRYTDYGRVSATDAVNGLAVSSRLNSSAVRAGVSYKF